MMLQYLIHCCKITIFFPRDFFFRRHFLGTWISGKCRISDSKKLLSRISDWISNIRCYILFNIRYQIILWSGASLVKIYNYLIILSDTDFKQRIGPSDSYRFFVAENKSVNKIASSYYEITLSYFQKVEPID